MSTSKEIRSRVSAIGEHLSASAARVDAADSLSSDHFDELAAAGLYGAFAPTSVGGLELDLAALCGMIEELASACLTTTFVWIQHFQLLRALLDAATTTEFRELLPLAIRGDVKGGVALGGLLPGPARLTASERQDGWLLNGEAPWVSGWGIVDVLFLAARQSNDTVASFVIDAATAPGIEVTRHRLSAMNASSTVLLTFKDVLVPRSRHVGIQPYAPGLEAPERLRVNGSLALGIARRCCGLLGSTSLDDELSRCRDDLDAVDTENIAVARARANELAVRASHVLAISRGSQSAIAGDISERTSREAALLLVFASRPAIKDALLHLMIDGR